MTKDQLKSLLCGYLAEWSSLDASMDSCAEDLWQRLQPIVQDAERYDFLRSNNAVVLECVAERRGFRSTAPNASREVWSEHEGWTVSTLPITDGPYNTMDEAVDAAMKLYHENGLL